MTRITLKCDDVGIIDDFDESDFLYFFRFFFKKQFKVKLLINFAKKLFILIGSYTSLLHIFTAIIYASSETENHLKHWKHDLN